jgi:FixJ family two-component response regulator
MKAGAHRILTKPFESRELIDAVAQVIASDRNTGADAGTPGNISRR